MNPTGQARNQRGGMNGFILATCLTLLLAATPRCVAEQFGPFTYRIVSDEIEITGYPKDLPGHVDIPAEIDGRPVRRITGGGNPGAFDGAFAFSAITSVSIPDSVTTIGAEAFGVCFDLGSVRIPDSVTSIGDSAFYQSNGLTNVVLGNAVTSIGELAFFHCFRLTRLSIPSSVLTIGDRAFEDCTALRSLSLGNGLKSIGSGAFLRCQRLRSVTLPPSIEFLGNNCFVLCSALRVAMFLGDAPETSWNLFERAAPGFRVLFLHGSEGFSSPEWRGFPAEALPAPPTPAGLWLLGHGLPAGTSLHLDPDGDGINLLTAYALDLDPTETPLQGLPVPVLGDGTLGIRFFAGRPELTYRVEWSPDLRTWQTGGVFLSEPAPDGERTASISTQGPNGFMRLIVLE